ncbi:hypothetical protein H3Z74_13355 [Sphingomonas alpina]|uniref:Uncharacterized protein n=1 Tax=Sphingomonas alpina TaxID=653931 RepID=A0A7H0LDP1_9SPHN|nr:hypothetical protein H3Z74_13355 [Sphingomonas alpina]
MARVVVVNDGASGSARGLVDVTGTVATMLTGVAKGACGKTVVVAGGSAVGTLD